MASRSSVSERVDWAVVQLMELRSTTAVVSEMAQRWGCSRRTAQRLTARAHRVLIEDLEAAGVDRTALVAQLEHGLLTAFSQALAMKHPAAATGVAREMRKLLQLSHAEQPLAHRPTRLRFG